MKVPILEPVRYRPYRNLFIAQVFSDLGNWFDFIAIEALIVYHWGLGAGALAAYVFTVGLPWVLIGPLGSVWVDRLPKRALMIGASLCRIPVVIGFIWAPNLWWLLPLVLLKEIMDVMYDPARQGAIRTLVPENLLYKANALSQLSMNGCKIIAPTLGGIFVTLSGPSTVFIIEAIGFALSTLFLWRLPPLTGDRPCSSKSNPSYWNELREGWRWIRQSPILTFTLSAMTISMFITWLFDKLIILWSKEMGLGTSEFGTIISAIAVGSILGSLLIGQWSDSIRKPLHMMCASGAVSGGIVAVLGLGGIHLLTGPTSMWLAVWLLIGLITPVFSILYITLLQSHTPAQLLGRVSSTANALQNSTMLVAPVLGAALAGVIGVGGVFLTAGLALLLLSTAAYAFLRRRPFKTDTGPKTDTKENSLPRIS